MEGCVLANSSDEKIDSTLISALSKEDLQNAINEIYARHGYIFGDDATYVKTQRVFTGKGSKNVVNREANVVNRRFTTSKGSKTLYI